MWETVQTFLFGAQFEIFQFSFSSLMLSLVLFNAFLSQDWRIQHIQLVFSFLAFRLQTLTVLLQITLFSSLCFGMFVHSCLMLFSPLYLQMPFALVCGFNTAIFPLLSVLFFLPCLWLFLLLARLLKNVVSLSISYPRNDKKCDNELKEALGKVIRFAPVRCFMVYFAAHSLGL